MAHLHVDPGETVLKFIHTADIHLDSPLSGLAAYKDAPADLLRTVTRDALARLVDEAIEEAVDFMAIAGYPYDSTALKLHVSINDE